MKDFVRVVGVDGRNRAFSLDDVLLLEDADDTHEVTVVTLVDGTQSDVVGSVESIIATHRSQK